MTAVAGERMKPFARRGLTAGEEALADEVFMGELDFGSIRMLALPPLPRLRPMVLGEVLWSGRYVVIWPQAEAFADFAATPPGQQGRFIHEMVHVWQAQRRTDLLKCKITNGRYPYRLTPGCRWDGFGIEQQAMIVEDAFRLSRGLKPLNRDVYPVAELERLKPFCRAEQPLRA